MTFALPMAASAMGIEFAAANVQSNRMHTPEPTVERRDGFRKILSNMAWLLGGKGFGAVASLIYLALLSRSLGIKDFGHFSLIFGTGQALVAIAGLQTWQTLVRFGARPVVEKDWPRFGRLAFFCGTIDLSGAAVGCVLAYIVYYGFGEMLGLNPQLVDMAFGFNCALLWSRLSTPNGIVRVLDRFDIASYVEAVVPAGRLLAATIIVFAGATIGRFLFAWAFFDLLAAAIYWFMAWKLAPQAIHWTNFGHWRQTLLENIGLKGFFGITYVSSTLDALYKQGPLLLVGALLGTSAAGLYKMADQLAQGIGALSRLVARAVLPEFAISQMTHNAHDFRKLVRQVSQVAAIGGVVVTAVALIFGEAILSAIGGAAFAKGAAVLVPLAIGAAFELAAVAYEPMMFATGHARYPLIARTVSVMAIAALIFALAGFGPLGVGWAVAGGMAIFYAVMSATVWLVLRDLQNKAEQ